MLLFIFFSNFERFNSIKFALLFHCYAKFTDISYRIMRSGNTTPNRGVDRRPDRVAWVDASRVGGDLNLWHCLTLPTVKFSCSVFLQIRAFTTTYPPLITFHRPAYRSDTSKAFVTVISGGLSFVLHCLFMEYVPQSVYQTAVLL